MAEAPTKTLGDVVALIRGTTYKSRLLDQPGPVLLGLATIGRDGGFRRDSLRTYGGDSPSKLVLGPGDLYVSLKDVTQSGDLLGAVARVPGDVQAGRLTQDTVKLELAGVPGDYVYWILRTPQYRAYCRSHAIGTTNLSLTRDDFLAFPLPNLTAGRRIAVELLAALDDKIELNRRINETLERTAEAIFRERFERAAAREGWQREPLERQVEIVRGLSYTGAGLADEGMPLHNLDSIHEGGGYKRAGIKFYNGAYKDRHAVRPGELIVANTDLTWNYRVIASPAIVPSRYGNVSLFSHHLYRVRPTPGSPFSSRLLYLLLRHGRIRREVAGYANGTTVNMLPLDALQKPEIPVPPASAVRKIDGLTAPLLDRIEQNENESETLAALRDTLLPKLISGEIRLRDAGRADPQAE